ncbi:MAG: biotin/lipoyl-containing protein [Pseudomonadota bacterium]
MEKTFRIKIEGKVYVVTVEDITAEGEQQLYPEPGSMRAQPSELAKPAGGQPSAQGAAAPLSAAGPGDEISPLAGVVKTLYVSNGQSVTEGDKLVALEAMKMITEVLATRAGTVGGIAVAPGDPVEAGQVLLRIA